MAISIDAQINVDTTCKLFIPRDRNVKDTKPDQSSKPDELKDSLPPRCGLKFEIDPQMGPYIGLDMTFDTLVMAIERNLLNELISAIKEILDNVSVGSAANIEEAVKGVAETIKKLIGSTELVWEQRIKWDFEKLIPPTPTPTLVVVERTIDAKSSINSDLVKFNLTVHSTVDNSPIGKDIIFDNSTKRQKKTSTFNDTQRVFKVIRDRKNKVIDDITLTLSIDGNANKAEEMLDALNEVRIKAAKLLKDITASNDDTSVADVLDTVLKVGAPVPGWLFGKLREAFSDEEVKNEPVDIADDVRKLFKEWIKLIKKIFKTEQGDLALNGLSYKIYCTTAAERDRLVDGKVKEKIPKIIKKVADGTAFKFVLPENFLKLGERELPAPQPSSDEEDRAMEDG